MKNKNLGLKNIEFIKIGSACLFDNYGKINYELLCNKAKEIEQRDSAMVVVVSGAIALGKMLEGEKKSNTEISNVGLQGYATVGQLELMKLYSGAFKKQTAQLLITSGNLVHEHDHIKDLILENARAGRITLVNYNDGIDFKQIRKDNDTLAADMLYRCGGKRLVLLGKYDGFLDANKKLIERVNHIDESVYDLCNGKSEHGRGGFNTKIDAAKIVMTAGAEMIVGNINYSLMM